jgi:transposase
MLKPKDILTKTFLEKELQTKTQKQISEETGISENTVLKYRKKLLPKRKITSETLEQLLIVEKKSKEEVAKIFRVHVGTINRIIRENNLKMDICQYCKQRFHSHTQALKFCSDECRVWSHIDKKSKNECWNYIGNEKDTGYGRVGLNGKTKLIHRVIWEIAKGPIPDNVNVCHTCDNKLCCNPKHLFLGTQKDNMEDCKQKGRIKNNPNKMHSKPFLTNEQILQIQKEYKKNNTGYKQLSKKYNVHYTTIYKIINLIGSFAKK